MGFLKKLGKKVTAPNAILSVILDKQTFSLGENLTGKMSVTSSEEFEAKQIRCELKVIETVRTKDKKQETKFGFSTGKEKEDTIKYTHLSQTVPVSGGITLTKGFMQEFRFSVPLPRGVPVSYHGRNAHNEWSIVGVIDVPKRPDVNQRVPFTVVH